MKNKLDIKVIKKLYDFGGLMSYQCVYFDRVSFTVRTLPPSFNENKVKKEVEVFKARGFEASYTSTMIEFNGAFKKR